MLFIEPVERMSCVIKTTPTSHSERRQFQTIYQNNLILSYSIFIVFSATMLISRDKQIGQWSTETYIRFC
jgi:hypothetical protein